LTHPDHLKKLCDGIFDEFPLGSCNKLCGVPYGAIPMTTILSQKTGIPMVMCRKNAKNHGTQRLVEGNYKRQETVLLVEDTITTGSSVLRTARILQNHGLKIGGVFAIMDVAAQRTLTLNNNNRSSIEQIPIFSLFTLKTFMKYLCTIPELKPAEGIVQQVYAYERFLSQRYLATRCSATRKLFRYMMEKQSNLVLSADLEPGYDTEDLIATLKTYTCGIKVHPRIKQQHFGCMVRENQWHRNFVIADLKLADIGHIAKQQWLEVADWADLVTVHLVSGPSILDGLRQAIREYNTTAQPSEPRGVLLIAEMSTQDDTLVRIDFQRVMELAEQYRDIVAGFICQSTFLDAIQQANWRLRQQFVYFSPGIRLAVRADDLGQQYRTPKQAIQDGTDCPIVGRGIYNDGTNMQQQAKMYRMTAWKTWQQERFQKIS
jgi:uridine monophosphate synthetase